jgi:hypothetical protein
MIITIYSRSKKSSSSWNILKELKKSNLKGRVPETLLLSNATTKTKYITK